MVCIRRDTYLIVGSDGRLAGSTCVGKQLFVALLTVWQVITQYVALTEQTRSTAPTTELSTSPVRRQRLREVRREQQLYHRIITTRTRPECG